MGGAASAPAATEEQEKLNPDDTILDSQPPPTHKKSNSITLTDITVPPPLASPASPIVQQQPTTGYAIREEVQHYEAEELAKDEPPLSFDQLRAVQQQIEAKRKQQLTAAQPQESPPAANGQQHRGLSGHALDAVAGSLSTIHHATPSKSPPAAGQPLPTPNIRPAPATPPHAAHNNQLHLANAQPLSPSVSALYRTVQSANCDAEHKSPGQGFHSRTSSAPHHHPQRLSISHQPTQSPTPSAAMPFQPHNTAQQRHTITATAPSAVADKPTWSQLVTFVSTTVKSAKHSLAADSSISIQTVNTPDIPHTTLQQLANSVLSIPTDQAFTEQLDQQHKRRIERRKAMIAREKGTATEKQLALSSEPPLAPLDISYQLEIPYDIAASLIDIDRALAALRAKVVPSRISEEQFFTLYFVQVIERVTEIMPTLNTAAPIQLSKQPYNSLSC